MRQHLNLVTVGIADPDPRSAVGNEAGGGHGAVRA